VDEAGSTIEPKGDFKMAAGGPEGSKYAARATGKTAASGQSIYVVLGFALTSSKVPYDARPATGVRFWAKGPARIRFKLPDVSTAPEGDRCTDCYNDFGVDLDLSDRWERYTVPFDKMGQQPGWGDRAPKISEDQLFAIQFQFGAADQQFEYWVDNIEFVGCGQEPK
jgi:endoglucanase